MELPLITNIQKYAIHDGKGIRTTVFLRDVRWPAGGVIIRRRRLMGRNLFFMKSVVQAAGSV